MIVCDMCGQLKDCVQRQIDCREYDICDACWKPVAEKLKGKGRKERETVFLPPVETKPEIPEMKPTPELPKIWGAADGARWSKGHSLPQ